MATTVINVSALPDYTAAHSDELLVKASLGSKTLDYVEIMPNVKHKDAINYLDTEIEFHEAACEWNPDGNFDFGQRYIEVKTIESQNEICWLDFQKKYLNYQLKFEAGRETLPFEEKITDSIVASAQKKLENILWNGDNTIGISGFLADAVEASAKTVDFATGMTVTGKIDAIVAALPVAMVNKGVNIFLSYSDFRAYVQEGNSACCNRPVVDAASDELVYAGDSRIKLVPVLGLEGSGKIVAATADALVYGTDVEGSESTFDIWYDKGDKKFKIQILFNAGTAIKWPDEVVVGA